VKNLKGFILYIGLLGTFAGYSQAFNADSLQQLLSRSEGRERVELLNTLGWELKYSNTKKAFEYSEEAFSLSGVLNYPKGKAISARNLAALCTLVNNSKDAIKHANEGILYASALKDTFTLAKLYNIKALVLEDQYAYSSAIELFTKSYELFDAIGDKTETAGILNNLAVLYGAINEKDLKLETLIKVIKLEEQAGNKLGLARTYNNVAGVYNELGDYKIALDFYYKALTYSREVKSSRYESSSLNGIGVIMSSLKKFDSAIIFYSEAASINRKNGYTQWLANNYLNMGVLFLNDLSDQAHARKYLGEASELYYSIRDWNNYVKVQTFQADWYLRNSRFNEAQKFLLQAESYSDSIASDEIKRDFSFLMYRMYKAKGNIPLALDYLELVQVLDDSLRAREKLKQSYEIQARYDLSRQQQENDRLRMESSLDALTIRKQEIVITASVIICLLLIFLIFLSMHSRKRIKRANIALFEISNQIRDKAMELQSANESKDKFLSIISHDLKNPISAITGLSDLLMDDTMGLSDEDKRLYIKYINDGCHSADHLLENLMKWVRSQTGKLEMNPKEFDLFPPVERAIALVRNAAFRKNISITSGVSENTMVVADHEMISTCLINLLTNAVKFTPQNGQIWVEPQVNGKSVSLEVRDSGVGISPENLEKLFKLDQKSGTVGTANEKGNGLGLLLVKEFIEKNGGNVEVKSEVGVGSSFILTIPTITPATQDASY